MAEKPSRPDDKVAHDEDSQSDVSELEEHDLCSNASDDLVVENEDVKTSARLTSEGRINVNITQRHHVLSNFILPHLSKAGQIHANEVEVPKWLTGDEEPPPPLNIVIQIVGSRGDVQPFVALGKVLKETYGHRVRLATHATFKKFVTENGLEFFNIGGDPANLMDYMVKNPGLIPGKQSLKQGDVGKRKREIKEIMQGVWRSCIEAGDGMDDPDAVYDPEDPRRRPFVASAIIANPPGFAHIHCAEKLGIPMHLMFTMPWSPTQAFPHPLANIQSTDTDPRVANFLSYPLVMLLTWQGLGGMINKFRENVLSLAPVSVMWTPILATMSKIPFTYCWSPALIPKPGDWGEHILVAGFYFLSLASSYTPDPALLAFLEAGPPPVYIGFGSIVVNDPNAMTNIILEGVKKARVRALVSKGWGGLGTEDLDVPENVFFLGNCPHDWLFKRVSAVVHHGGAGTTAAGIAAGVPTLVVPFFGDQPFWGSMVHRAGAGPVPIPHKVLTADNLAEAIKFCQTEEAQSAAQRMGEQIREENGPLLGSQHFHAMLPMDRVRCAVDDQSAAVWRIRKTETRLGALAAAVLCNEGILKAEDLKLNRTREYDLSDQPFDPITGVVSSTLGTLGNLMVGTLNLPGDVVNAVKGDHSRMNKTEQPQSLAGASRTTPELGSVGSSSKSTKSVYAKSRNYGSSVRDGLVVVRKDWFNIVNFPREVTQGLAKGFHNAPKLYGDTTVRTPDKVTSLRSGLVAGGKQLGLGLYDAFTGLVTQPYNGAKKEGAVGFLKGAGKGVGGLLLKPNAAVLGGVGYAWEGVYRHMHSQHQHTWERRHGIIPIEEQLTASRLAEGYLAFHDCTPERRATILRRWASLQTLKADREKASKDKTLYSPVSQRSRRSAQLNPSATHTRRADSREGSIDWRIGSPSSTTDGSARHHGGTNHHTKRASKESAVTG